MAGSGTCMHVNRKELREVVLVRQTELACRNTYDQDLWKPSDNPVLTGSDAASSGGEIPDPDVLYDLPAAGFDAPADHDVEDEAIKGSQFTDRVTSVQVPRGPSKSRYNPQPEYPPHVQNEMHSEYSDPRKSAVQSARIRLEREKQLENQRILEKQIQAVDSFMNGNDQVAGNASPSLVRPSSNTSNRPSPILTAGRDEVTDEELELSIRRPRVRKASSNNDGRESLLRPRDADVENESPPADDAREVEVGEQRTEPLPTGDVRALIEKRDREPLYPRSDRPMVQRASDTQEPFVHIDGAIPASRAPSQRGFPMLQLQTAEPSDPIDRVERLATLRRCCGTCRDFRQIGNEARGWCSNPYAFGERRMVQSDQLTCRSSMGMWWMPNDDIWLEHADTSHHGRPTPLLDASLKTQRTGETGKDSLA